MILVNLSEVLKEHLEADPEIDRLTEGRIYSVDLIRDIIIEYWREHYMVEHMCSLCGQSGIIHTEGIRTPAGLEVGRANYCICLNGQMRRVSEEGKDKGEATIFMNDEVVREVPNGIIDGSNVIFILSRMPRKGTEQLFLNYALLTSGVNNDYTISGATITLARAPLVGDRLDILYLI